MTINGPPIARKQGRKCRMSNVECRTRMAKGDCETREGGPSDFEEIGWVSVANKNLVGVVDQFLHRPEKTDGRLGLSSRPCSQRHCLTEPPHRRGSCSLRSPTRQTAAGWATLADRSNSTFDIRPSTFVNTLSDISFFFCAIGAKPCRYGMCRFLVGTCTP